MVLKKQTVWLITMLSLLIVLSVYYMTAPGDDVAVVDPDGEEQNGEENGESEGGAETDGTGDLDVSGMTVDELFATTRLEMQDTRSMLKEEWSNVISSATATTEEKSEARDQILELQTIAQKESELENIIQHAKDYRDVLVQKEDDVVSITVIAEELSKTEANQLMQMARDEFGVMDVRVSIQQDDV